MAKARSAKGGTRIDKWLWCVRAYKTRQQAAEACRAGRVMVGGHGARASRDIRPGDVVEINLGGWKRTLKATSEITQRVKASALPAFVEDLTPPEEKEQARERRIQNMLGRPQGAGRPTKRDRRAWKRAFYGDVP